MSDLFCSVSPTSGQPTKQAPICRNITRTRICWLHIRPYCFAFSCYEFHWIKLSEHYFPNKYIICFWFSSIIYIILSFFHESTLYTLVSILFKIYIKCYWNLRDIPKIVDLWTKFLSYGKVWRERIYFKPVSLSMQVKTSDQTSGYNRSHRVNSSSG